MKKRIHVRTLVIDPDPTVCRAVQDWLEEAAHDVAVFSSADDGLQFAAHTDCQLALVDLRISETSGSDVIATLHETTPNTRIVAMCAVPDTTKLVEAVRSGARDLLTKPLQREALISALDRQLTELGITGHTEQEFNKRLGRRLRVLRQQSEQTLSEVASASGISAAQLSQIELGKNATTTWTLARICSALGQPLARLFEGL